MNAPATLRTRARRREPTYVAEYAKVWRALGETAFNRKYLRHMLIGYGITANLAEHPRRWRRRTLPMDEHKELEAVQSIVDRVWPVFKKPGCVSGPRVILGASADCDIVVPDNSTSTRHCAFSFEPERFYITDLGSLNSTRLNGEPLPPNEQVRLRSRDAIHFGRIKVQFLARDCFHELVSRHATGNR